MSHQTAVEIEQACLNLVPNENDGWDQETLPYAEDAAAALTFAYRSKLEHDNLENAYWAARRVLDCYDHKLREDDPQDSVQTLDDKRILSEVERQRQALNVLRTPAPDWWMSLTI